MRLATIIGVFLAGSLAWAQEPDTCPMDHAPKEADPHEVTAEQLVAIGEEINADSLEQLVNIEVFETTDKPVDWHVQERHVVFGLTLDGIGVTDTLVIQNPSDKAWLGTANDTGQRVSLVLDLPAGATKVESGRNLQLLGAIVIGDKVVCTAPTQAGINHSIDSGKE